MDRRERVVTSAPETHAVSEKISGVIRLCKLPLCLMVALSSLFGYLLYDQRITLQAVALFFGILFLACGAASLNSLQEIDQDRKFRRTRTRPLVTGLFSPKTGAALSFIFLLLGLAVLFFTLPIVPACLAALTLVLYNFVYTPLKQRSAFAILPGGIVGGLPPLIGWVTAGGGLDSVVIWAVMLLFFLWQIPHFFLVILENRKDYSKVARQEILPLSSPFMSRTIVFIWTMAFISVLLFFTTIEEFLHLNARIGLLATGTLLCVLFGYQLFLSRNTSYQLLFKTLNTALAGTMVIICSGIL